MVLQYLVFQNYSTWYSTTVVVVIVTDVDEGRLVYSYTQVYELTTIHVPVQVQHLVQNQFSI